MADFDESLREPVQRLARSHAQDRPDKRWLLGAILVRCRECSNGLRELTAACEGDDPNVQVRLLQAIGHALNAELTAASNELAVAQLLIERADALRTWKWEEQLAAFTLRDEVLRLLGRSDEVVLPSGEEQNK